MIRVAPVTGPPWVLTPHVVTVARPQPAPISVTAPRTQVLTVAWPRVRVTGEPPPPPAEVRLQRPPQAAFRWRLPAVTAALLADPLPPRRAALCRWSGRAAAAGARATPTTAASATSTGQPRSRPRRRSRPAGRVSALSSSARTRSATNAEAWRPTFTTSAGGRPGTRRATCGRCARGATGTSLPSRPGGCRRPERSAAGFGSPKKAKLGLPDAGLRDTERTGALWGCIPTPLACQAGAARSRERACGRGGVLLVNRLAAGCGRASVALRGGQGAVLAARPVAGENGRVRESAAQCTERKRLVREAARRRQAVATLRLAEATAGYAADQVSDGLSPGEARAAVLDAAGELAELAGLLRKLARPGPAERRQMARTLHALGWDKHRIAVRLGLSDSAVKYYFRPRPGRASGARRGGGGSVNAPRSVIGTPGI
jgi:hypothetical protein